MSRASMGSQGDVLSLVAKLITDADFDAFMRVQEKYNKGVLYCNEKSGVELKLISRGRYQHVLLLSLSDARFVLKVLSPSTSPGSSKRRHAVDLAVREKEIYQIIGEHPLFLSPLSEEVAPLKLPRALQFNYLPESIDLGLFYIKLKRAVAPLDYLRLMSSILWKLMEALEFLHKKGIFHRDVKPANVLVTPRGDVKLIDFGFAGSKRSYRCIGTETYLAPEIKSEKRENDYGRADEWGYMCIALIVLMGVKLRDNITDKNVCRFVVEFLKINREGSQGSEGYFKYPNLPDSDTRQVHSSVSTETALNIIGLVMLFNEPCAKRPAIGEARKAGLFDLMKVGDEVVPSAAAKPSA